MIEFKYYAKGAFRKASLADFTVQKEDTEQIAGYVAGLRTEYPQAQIRQFVICFIGNEGFRLFEVTA